MSTGINFGQYFDSFTVKNPFTDMKGGVNTSPQAYGFIPSIKKDVYTAENLGKISRLQESQKMFPTSGTMATPVTNPISSVKPQTFGQTISGLNKNPFLSFVRGEAAKNTPLNEDAIIVENGVVGYSLNLIC
jgi:hypothetical protein